MTHLSVEQRAEFGRSRRKAAPRTSHGDWTPDPNRPDPVRLLEEQNATRVPFLVPIRHARMQVSPFTFYRGAARIMAADLAPTPTSGLTVQLGGDAHLSNFGAYASPERRLVFDQNDFDETLPGPWEWDLKRLAASFVVAGQFHGYPAAASRQVALAAVRSYRQAMAGFAGHGLPAALVRLHRRRRHRRRQRPPAQGAGEAPRPLPQAGHAQDEPAGPREAGRGGGRRVAHPQRAAGAVPAAGDARRRRRRDAGRWPRPASRTTRRPWTTAATRCSTGTSSSTSG